MKSVTNIWGDRLEQINKCMNELQEIWRMDKTNLHPEHRFGCTLGEFDWLDELHRILHELS